MCETNDIPYIIGPNCLYTSTVVSECFVDTVYAFIWMCRYYSALLCSQLRRVSFTLVASIGYFIIALHCIRTENIIALECARIFKSWWFLSRFLQMWAYSFYESRLSKQMILTTCFEYKFFSTGLERDKNGSQKISDSLTQHYAKMFNATKLPSYQF